MISTFFLSFNCNDPQIYSPQKPKSTNNINPNLHQNHQNQKVAYSFKYKKHTFKSINQNHTPHIIHQNLKYLNNLHQFPQSPSNNHNRFQIFRQVSLKIKPQPKKIQKPISSLSSSIVKLPMLNLQMKGFQKDNLRSTQETQLCGAQSTLYDSKQTHEGFGNIKNSFFSNNQNTYVERQTGRSTLCLKSKKESEQYQTNGRFLMKGKSQGNLMKLSVRFKRQFSSMMTKDTATIHRIDQENFQHSPTFQKTQNKGTSEIISPKKFTRRQASFIHSFKLIGSNRSKTKLDQMQIRSTCSIKEQQSADQFSQVLEGSKLSLQRKFSLAQKFTH